MESRERESESEGVRVRESECERDTYILFLIPCGGEGRD